MGSARAELTCQVDMQNATCDVSPAEWEVLRTRRLARKEPTCIHEEGSAQEMGRSLVEEHSSALISHLRRGISSPFLSPKSPAEICTCNVLWKKLRCRRVLRRHQGGPRAQGPLCA